MSSRTINKEQICAGMETFFGQYPLIQDYDPDLIQVEASAVRRYMRIYQDNFLRCNRAINRMIYDIMDSVRGSEYEAYYVKHFGGPGVPESTRPVEEAAS